jgi:hypothetical protein
MWGTIKKIVGSAESKPEAAGSTPTPWMKREAEPPAWGPRRDADGRLLDPWYSDQRRDRQQGGSSWIPRVRRGWLTSKPPF